MGASLMSPVYAAEMFHGDGIHHKQHGGEVKVVKSKSCDCHCDNKKYSEAEFKALKKNHPMNSSILRDKR